MDPDLARLRNAVSCELMMQLGMRDEHIELEDVPEVAYAVAVRLRHAFRIEWAPTWADDREDDDSLGPDAATFHGSALPEGVRFPVFDHGWPRDPGRA
ncbi:MAG: hypothetical protein HOV79_01600 [Hamadaea sp.]|nr:hypothetical protein [Hamadaea sp.]